MAMYKARFTVYKDPEGKTLKGPTGVYFLGDLCSVIGLFGVIEAILALMDGLGAGALAGGIVVAAAGFALCVVLHKKARKDAEAAILSSLGQTEEKIK